MCLAHICVWVCERDCFTSHTFCSSSEGKVSLSFRALEYFGTKLPKTLQSGTFHQFFFSFLLLLLLLHLCLLFLADLLFLGAAMPMSSVLYTQLSRFFFIGQWLEFQHNKDTHKKQTRQMDTSDCCETFSLLLFPGFIRSSGQDTVFFSSWNNSSQK